MCIWFQIQSLFWRRRVGSQLGVSSWARLALVAVATSRPRQVPVAARSTRSICIFPRGTDLGTERRHHQGIWVTVLGCEQLPETNELPFSVHSFALHPLLIRAEPDSVPAPKSSQPGRGRQAQTQFLLNVACAGVEASAGARRAQRRAAEKASCMRG